MKLLQMASRILLLLLLSTASAIAQPNPSITNWGSPPGSPPPWQSPDVWVDNDGDEIVNEPDEPAQGITNRLFARVRNLGSADAHNVQVRFAFAPYGAWTPASHADFKEIGVVTVPLLGAAGSPDEVKTVELEWDLSNTAENNGGAWGGFAVKDFDHFCMLVTLTSDEDSNPSNNIAQHNFFQVDIAPGKASLVKFLIANPNPQPAAAEVLVRGLPDNWRFQLDGVEQGRTLLKAREVRLVALTFTPPRRNPETGSPANAHVDISLRLDGRIVGGISFDAREPMAASRFPPAGGSLSPYMIGTYDHRGGRATMLHVLNPTGRPLRVLVAFFNDDEKALGCLRERLSPNDLLEIDVRRHVKAPLGVVKIVSLELDGDRPVAGVVGYQRTFGSRFFWRSGFQGEAVLHAIPEEILAGDMEMIRRACP